MKKIIVISLMIFSLIQTISGMIPGPPILIDCPNCGNEKKLMSLISGNTFGAVQWSDAYQFAPMSPKLSPVQKCPACGEFFLLSKVEERYASDGNEDQFSSDTGRLSFPEIKEAMKLLYDESLSKNDEIRIRMEFLHRFNDAYRDYAEALEEDGDAYKKFRSSDDIELHHSNLKALIALLDENDSDAIPLVAELYREDGDFSKCLALLKNYNSNSSYVVSIVEEIIKKAKLKDSKVFILNYD